LCVLAEFLLVCQDKTDVVVKKIIREMNSGFVCKYLGKIVALHGEFGFDNTLLGIFFFVEVLQSNLWHLTMHKRYQYPEKKSLENLVHTAAVGCDHLFDQHTKRMKRYHLR